MAETAKCKKCKGTGTNRVGACGTCKGSGQVTLTRDESGGVTVAPAVRK